VTGNELKTTTFISYLTNEPDRLVWIILLFTTDADLVNSTNITDRYLRWHNSIKISAIIWSTLLNNHHTKLGQSSDYTNAEELRS